MNTLPADKSNYSAGENLSWAVDQPYGASDLGPDAADGYVSGKSVRDHEIKCCIRDCAQWLEQRRVGHARPDALYCARHDISMSTTPTYIYRDLHRNFIVGRELLDKVSKVESWRLGNETSEDAVSWNVFVSLFVVAGLRQCFEMLTGVTPAGEPKLYLWGNRISRDKATNVDERLLEVRRSLEARTGIPTEPDVMLRVPGQAVVLVEAKFGSPNGRFAGKENRFGSIADYLLRYRARDSKHDPLNREWIAAQPPDQILEQLCRNAIFATWLAKEGEAAFLTNLVLRESEQDVEQQFNQHLRPGVITFHRRTWEDIAALPIIKTAAAARVQQYLANKTLRLRKAFGTVS